MSVPLDIDRLTDPHGKWIPAYGPIDGLLGYVMFYVFLDRATPVIVPLVRSHFAVTEGPLVRVGLATVLWLVLAITVLDQARRQLAALGIGTDRDVERARRSRSVPSDSRFLLYAIVVIVGGMLAALTFDFAVATGISLIRIVVTLDAPSFDPGAVVVLVVFLLAYGGATRAFDRLVVGGLRRFLVSSR